MLAPAADPGQMDQIIRNSTTNGVIQAVFALLVIVVVANAVVIWVRAVRVGSLPTTEVPHTPSQIVAPADFVATREEKEAVAAWEAERGELTGQRGHR